MLRQHALGTQQFVEVFLRGFPAALRFLPFPAPCVGDRDKAAARIVGPDGKLYARATTTCLVFETR